MFTQKQKQLFDNQSNKTSASPFIDAAFKQTSITQTEKGDKAYTTTGNPFIDQFGNLDNYRNIRSFDEISKDCELLWAHDKNNSVKFMFFIRMISRNINHDGISTEISQKGAELKHEGIMRLIWLHMKDPIVFWKNAHLIPWFGSWKDIFMMLRYDLIYNGWEGRKLDWNQFGMLIFSGLSNKHESSLIKKYLPQIKAKSKCSTVESQANCLIAKYICSLLYGKSEHLTFEEKYKHYRKYAKLKTSGTAHEWQQLISKQKYDLIDFNKISGRALSLLVKSKFLINQELSSKYSEWIGSPETKDVKYTGFVHELFKDLRNGRPNQEQITTINKQFETLVNKCRDDGKETNMIVVRDTSGSMSSSSGILKMSCGDIAKAIALYFSEFLQGKFHKNWIEFNREAKMRQWIGETPFDKWTNDDTMYNGCTNFMSVIELFVSLRKQIDESEFPTGIICISDNQLDPFELDRSNIEALKDVLTRGGFSKNYVDNFVVVLWNIQGSPNTTHQTYGNIPNVFYFSGYSASIISFLDGGKVKSTYDLFDEAMNQESLSWITFNN